VILTLSCLSTPGESRTDIDGRVMGSSIVKKTNDCEEVQVFRFRKLQVTTRSMPRESMPTTPASGAPRLRSAH
jgi:hypothetical protein